MYTIQVHSFICDSPARAYVQCIKSHGGYSSCERCMEPGINANKRTDQSFVLQSDEDHHIGESPLLTLPIGLVSRFGIDYMHCICLGVICENCLYLG
ncbi:hypothetical protein PPYR_00340, partial [Photinus pyralis]